MIYLAFFLFALAAPAQLETEPHPFDSFLKDILNFQEPTGIRGTLRYLEEDQETLWLNWDERSDDGPLFTTGWKLVPGEAILAVRPQDAEQWEQLRQLSKGTRLELIIQENDKGHRLILSYRDLSASPKVPL
jgi:hypothetical protein